LRKKNQKFTFTTEPAEKTCNGRKERKVMSSLNKKLSLSSNKCLKSQEKVASQD
jgi:hypothetical protein